MTQNLTFHQNHMLMNRLGYLPREEALLGMHARDWIARPRPQDAAGARTTPARGDRALMTALHPTATTRPTALMALAGAAAVAWAAFAALVLAGVDTAAILLLVVLLAVATTSSAVVLLVRSRPATSRGPVVLAVMSPFLVLGAMTPLVAQAGPIVLAIAGLVVSVAVLTVAAVTTRRASDRA